MKTRWKAVLWTGAILGLLAVPELFPRYSTDLILQGLIFAIVAMGLDIIVGYVGLPSLGHAGFVGLSSYALAITSVNWGWDPWLGSAMGLIVVLITAMIVGLIVLRCKGIYFLVITLAFGQMLWGIAIKWTEFTGGYNGIPGVMRPELVGYSLWEPDVFYYFVLMIFLIVVGGLYVFVSSPVGRILKGIRESESRMRMLGYKTKYYKHVAFSLSALVAGVGGILLAFFDTYVGPSTVSWTLSAQLLLMVIIGSSGTLFGPAVAGVFLVLFENWVSEFTNRWTMIMGALYVIAMILMDKNFFSRRGWKPKLWLEDLQNWVTNS